VSGALALALSCAPSTTNVQLRDALYRTAEDLGAGGWDSSYGHGLARVDRLVADLCGGGTDPGPDPEPEPEPTDPDPSTPTVTSGQTTTLSLSASSADHYVKIAVPAGASQLQVVMDGPNCSLLSCSLDADLSTRAGARPTDSVYACRPYATGSDETCTHAAPTEGYWYLRVKRYSGSGTVTLKATVS
jgi:serine protease